MLMILLANILILAHAVVPHHHHNKVFVAIVNILDHDSQDIFNHEHGHEHHHDGETNHHNGSTHHHDNNNEDCLLTEAEAAATLKILADDGISWSVETLQDNDDGSLILLAAIGLYELSFTPILAKTTIGDGHTLPAGIRIS